MNKQINVVATGETVTFTKTVADTNGEFLEMICYLPAHQKAAPPKHIHKTQTESFKVMEGRLGIFIGNKKFVLETGQTMEVPANTVHGWFAASEGDIKFRSVFKPALDIEWSITEMFASMNRNRSMKPGVFEATYILSQLKDQLAIAGIPLFIQRLIFPVIAGIGKSMGMVRHVKPKHG